MHATLILRTTAAALKKHIAEDKRMYHEEIAKTATKAAEKGDLKTLYAMVRKLKPFKKRPLSQMVSKDGKVAATPCEAAEIWRDHCAELLLAQRVSMQALVEKARQTDAQARREPPNYDELHTRASLAHIFKNNSSGKGVG